MHSFLNIAFYLVKIFKCEVSNTYIYKFPIIFQLFSGNVDGDSIKFNQFDIPIIAQWIRINPTRWRDRISLRVELYGCDYGKFSEFSVFVVEKLSFPPCLIR